MEDINGLIFNIQKFSLHDGPGIRTVVFLKGCPFNCPWCSNPESLSGKIQITWNQHTCSHCNTCIDSCPQKAISTTHNRIIIDDDLCNGCLLCTQNCPTKALNHEGDIRNVSQVMHEVAKDKLFYEESGGGLTLSGGEVLQQADFAIELLKAAKSLGIHTAVETTSSTDIDTFKRFIEPLDLLLCDIKHYDSEKLEQTTGISLEIILANIKYALSINKNIIVRIPVIPGFNYSLPDAEKFSELLNSLGIQNISLLPYHNYGENKYTFLNKTYSMSGASSINKNDSAYIAYTNIFKKHRLTIIN